MATAHKSQNYKMTLVQSMLRAGLLKKVGMILQLLRNIRKRGDKCYSKECSWWYPEIGWE